MRFDIITLFPELFPPWFSTGVIRRAFDSGAIEVRYWNPRDHAEGNYRRVDDRPYGGGPGMVMMAEPLRRCLQAVRDERPDEAPVVLFSPVGQTLRHATVSRWSRSAGAILICGRYEGIDQRFIDLEVDHQLSLGDFVLSGGEIAALALLDATARLLPGVLNDGNSHAMDSFNPDLDGLLDCPHYTRPEIWAGVSTPAVLLSGHHGDIETWRRAQRLRLTAIHRPDLIAEARTSGRLTEHDERRLHEWAVDRDAPDGI